jgi:hypothetical protein
LRGRIFFFRSLFFLSFYNASTQISFKSNFLEKQNFFFKIKLNAEKMVGGYINYTPSAKQKGGDKKWVTAKQK